MSQYRINETKADQGSADAPDPEMIRQRCELEDRLTIRKFLDTMDPALVRIVVVHVSTFLESDTSFIPAEISFTVFSIKEGIVDNFWTIVDPYSIPLGYYDSVRTSAKDLGLPMPPFSNQHQDYRAIITKVEQFLKKHENPVLKETLVFCHQESANGTYGCFTWLYEQCGMKTNLRLYSIGSVVRRLSNIGISRRATREGCPIVLLQAKYMNHDELIFVNATSSLTRSIQRNHKYFDDERFTIGPEHKKRLKTPDMGFYSDQDVDDFLNSSEHAFVAELGCLFHMNDTTEGIQYCSLNTTNRYAYTILSSLTSHYGVFPLSGYHYYDYNLQEFEKQRRLEMLEKGGHNLKSFQETPFFLWNEIPPLDFDTRQANLNLLKFRLE